MVDALEDAEKPVESTLYRDELHGFIDERNRIDFHEKLAAFFARHLARARRHRRGDRVSGSPPTTGASR